MKRTIALILAAGAITPVLARTNVGVSIGINQPGMYGRIDIGDNNRYGQPQLVYPQPVIIAPPAVVYERRPIYLYVPPAHQSHWRQYCGRYQACGQPVYFVQERWVRDRWQHEHPGQRPRWDARQNWNGHQGRPEYSGHPGRDDHHGHGGRDDHRDNHGRDRGPGNGHGHGHGRD